MPPIVHGRSELASDIILDEANILLRAKETDAALRLLNAALKRSKLDPDTFRIHRKLASVYRRTNDDERCELHLEAALKIGPKDPEARVAWAECSLRRRGTSLQALEDTHRFLEDMSKDGDLASKLIHNNVILAEYVRAQAKTCRYIGMALETAATREVGAPWYEEAVTKLDGFYRGRQWDRRGTEPVMARVLLGRFASAKAMLAITRRNEPNYAKLQHVVRMENDDRKTLVATIQNLKL